MNNENIIAMDCLFGSIDRAKQPASLSTHIALSSYSSDIDGISLDQDNKIKVIVNNLGIGNLNGPLQYCYIEKMLFQINNHNYHMYDLLSIFNHRLISLFYCAEKSISPYMHFGKDSIYYSFFAACAADTTASIDCLKGTTDDFSIANLVWSGNFNTYIIERVLKYMVLDMSDIAVQIKHDGKWCDAKAQQMRIGNGRLNENILGDKILIPYYGVICTIVCYDLQTYNLLLPNGDLIKKLITLLQNNMDWKMDIYIDLSLDASCNDMCQASLNKVQLGYNSVLGNGAGFANRSLYQ